MELKLKLKELKKEKQLLCEGNILLVNFTLENLDLFTNNDLTILKRYYNAIHFYYLDTKSQGRLCYSIHL